MCEKTLPCGHQCGGVKGEEECLPCLHGCSPPVGADTSNWDKLKQDADDMCMICYTEGLSCAPSIQVSRTLRTVKTVGLTGNIHSYLGLTVEQFV